MTDTIAELRALLAKAKDACHCLSIPGDPAYPIEQERKRSTERALQNAAVAALPALLDRVEAGEWRPIETAPKDGSMFDLWVPSYAEPGKGYRVANLWFDADGALFRGRDPQPVNLAHAPTHWRPLPEAPQQKADTP